MRIHCFENVDKALQFLRDQRVHLEMTNDKLGQLWFRFGCGESCCQEARSHRCGGCCSGTGSWILSRHRSHQCSQILCPSFGGTIFWNYCKPGVCVWNCLCSCNRTSRFESSRLSVLTVFAKTPCSPGNVVHPGLDGKTRCSNSIFH